MSGQQLCAADFQDPRAAKAFAGSEVLLGAANAWREVFGRDLVSERVWVVITTVLGRDEPQSDIAFFDLETAFLANLRSDKRVLSRTLGELEKAGLVQCRGQVVEISDLLPRQYGEYLSRSGVVAVRRVMDWHGEPEWTPSDRDVDALQQRIADFWTGYAERWRGFLKNDVVGVTDLDVNSKAQIASKLFSSSYWFILTYVWQEQHKVRNDLAEHHIVKEDILSGVRDSIGATFDHTQNKIKELRGYGILETVYHGRKATFALKQSYEAKRNLQVELFDLADQLARELGASVPRRRSKLAVVG